MNSLARYVIGVTVLYCVFFAIAVWFTMGM